MQMELSKQGKHFKQAYYVQGMHASKEVILVLISGGQAR
jgi:hypothetical protein